MDITALVRNDYGHTPQDTLDKLSAESLGIVGRVVIRMLNDRAMIAGASHMGNVGSIVFQEHPLH